jgi:hypothetical protein
VASPAPRNRDEFSTEGARLVAAGVQAVQALQHTWVLSPYQLTSETPIASKDPCEKETE